MDLGSVNYFQKQLKTLEHLGFIKEIVNDVMFNSGFRWLHVALQFNLVRLSIKQIEEIETQLDHKFYQYAVHAAEVEIAKFQSGDYSIIDELVDFTDSPPKGFVWGKLAGYPCINYNYDESLERSCNHTLSLLDNNAAINEIARIISDEHYPTLYEKYEVMAEEEDWEWKECGNSEHTATTYSDAEIYSVISLIHLATHERELTELEYFKSHPQDASSYFNEYKLDSLKHRANDSTSRTYFESISQSMRAYVEAVKWSGDLKMRAALALARKKSTKEALSNRASLGGQGKAAKTKQIKDYILRTYDKGSYKSANQAAHELKDEAENFARSNDLPPLARSNAQRTIASWIREHIKHTPC